MTLKPTLRTLFFNTAQRLRNGWWILIFIGFIALTRFAYRPLTHGLKSLGLAELWLEPASFLFTLLATWACTRLRREPLSSVGYRLNRRWFREIAWGTLFGVGTAVAVVGLIWAVGGVRFELDPARHVGTLLTGLYLFLFVALLEENLYRGFIFQRLLDGVGIWPAQIALALLFALAHEGNPGMRGSTEIVASLDLFLGSVMLGLAYLRTRSLALPVGLHLGWNWTLGHVLGFGVSGYDHAGWLQPVFQGHAEWITGGAFGPESSVFSPLVSLLMILLLWRWKGSVAAPTAA
ncbi:MAG: type II CAAX endopeptidase family protein [Candidatus Eisenbacteria bacterium]